MALNQLEQIRLRLGISRPEMLRTIGAREGREGPFLCTTEQVDPIFLRRAIELEQLYEIWKSEIFQKFKQTLFQKYEKRALREAVNQERRRRYSLGEFEYEGDPKPEWERQMEREWQESQAERFEQFDPNEGRLTSREFAALLGTYEIRVLRMRKNGILEKSPPPKERVDGSITLDDIRELFDINEHFLENTQGQGQGRTSSRRAPFSGFFTKWLRSRRSHFLREAYPEEAQVEEPQTPAEATA